MPEGPHIRSTADRLRGALAGKCVESFASRLKKAEAEEWREKVEGRLVLAVRSHGKNLFIDFDSGWTLYSHMMMWGSWHVHGKGEAWRKEERLARVVLGTAEHVAVLFSAPVCEMLKTSELSTHRTSLLGPDLLAEGHGAEAEAEIIRRLKGRGCVAVGEALLDQTVTAGIGNILKSEILFRSGIDPRRPVAGLTDVEIARLVEVSLDFMRRSYETGGFRDVFLPPELRAKVPGLGYVYGRSGRACHVCGGRVEMFRQGTARRMTFFCPGCQR